jgi:hypothetical protein
MNHALEPHRKLAQRRRGADRQRLIELPRGFHVGIGALPVSLGFDEALEHKAERSP